MIQLLTEAYVSDLPPHRVFSTGGGAMRTGKQGILLADRLFADACKPCRATRRWRPSPSLRLEGPVSRCSGAETASQVIPCKTAKAQNVQRLKHAHSSASGVGIPDERRTCNPSTRDPKLIRHTLASSCVPHPSPTNASKHATVRIPSRASAFRAHARNFPSSPIASSRHAHASSTSPTSACAPALLA